MIHALQRHKIGAIRWRKWATVALIMILGAFLAGCAMLAYLFPILQLEPLTGRFSVGRISRHLTDESRIEPNSPALGAKRELMVHLWYPAEPLQAGSRAPYVTGARPGHRYWNLWVSKSRSQSDAPIAHSETLFPVILFSAAIGANCYQYAFLLEELASKGFVVVGIDHPYSSGRMVFPDGREINETVSFVNMATPETLASSTRLIEADLALRVEDVRFVLDTLARWNGEPLGGGLTGRLDLARIGMAGHSYGGSTAVEACRRDSRILSGINMDGILFGESKRLGVDKPFLTMSDDSVRPSPQEMAKAGPTGRFALQTISSYYDDVDRFLQHPHASFFGGRHFSHLDYSDVPLYSRASRASTLDPRRAHTLVVKYVNAFFRQTLLGEPQPLLDATSNREPEVIYTATHDAIPNVPSH